MEIKLNEKKEFIVKYDKASFTFKNDSRSFFSLISQGFSRDAIADACKKDLVKIEGLKTADRDVRIDDFEALPIEIYIHVLNGYSAEVDKIIKSFDKDTKKKKRAKK